MNKIVSCVTAVVLLLAVCLTACGRQAVDLQNATSSKDTASYASSEPVLSSEIPSKEGDTEAASSETASSEIATPSVPEPPTSSVPEPVHSDLYIPGVSVEDVIRYFNEICLDAEFVNGGDATRLQKWTAPIRYILYGDYTDEDLATLSAFTDWLNTIDGFPGIAETQFAAEAGLRIHFCSQAEMTTLLGENFSEMDGGVTFWYEQDEIYDGIICYRTDLDQHLRNSVILEEIYNGLGPVQDTWIRTDSIAYAGFSEPQSLTEVDELILKLLYHPSMQCGMDAQACAAVIRELYY